MDVNNMNKNIIFLLATILKRTFLFAYLWNKSKQETNTKGWDTI